MAKRSEKIADDVIYPSAPTTPRTTSNARVKAFRQVWKIYFKKASKCFFLSRVLGYYVGQGSCMALAPSPRLENVPGWKGRLMPGTLKAFDHLSVTITAQPG
ncbi:hypothetical protein PFL02_53170 [Pseudomonas fluorescens]|nr:hypothetical protein PFL02_53170 [Pseudomonas fluorescens]